MLRLFSISLILILLSGCSNNNKHQYTGVLEGTAVRVPALSGGQITELYVDTGDPVEKNQKIAAIDSTELVFQRQQLQAALLELRIQKEIAATNLEKVSADVAYAKEKHDRVLQLYQKNSTSQQNLDDVDNQLQSVSSAQRTARQNLQSLAARQQQIQAQLHIVDKKIHDTVILAPVAGIITSKYCESGEAVIPLSAVVEIIDIHKLKTRIYISEKMLTQVKYGQSVTVLIDGIDKALPGQINWVSPKAEFTPKSILTPETRTSLVYAVEIDIENPDGLLKYGMPVVIEL